MQEQRRAEFKLGESLAFMYRGLPGWYTMVLAALSLANWAWGRKANSLVDLIGLTGLSTFCVLLGLRELGERIDSRVQGEQMVKDAGLLSAIHDLSKKDAGLLLAIHDLIYHLSTSIREGEWTVKNIGGDWLVRHTGPPSE